MRANLLSIIGAGFILATAALVHGEILYQNTTVDTGENLNFPDGQTIGQQIWLGTTTPEYLTNFSFEYYSPNANFSGSVQMEVVLYANDGTPAYHGYDTPGTVLYNSGWINILSPFAAIGTNYATAVFDRTDLLNGVGTGASPMLPYLFLPTNFTFSVTFSGLSGGDSVGLENYGTPTVGGNYGDYWFYTGGGWELLTNGTPTSFGAQFSGQTPEPTVFALGSLGAVMIAGLIRRRRK